MSQHRNIVAFLLALAALGAGSQASGQTLPAGPQVLTFFSDVDDTEQPYALYLPPNYDPSKRYPLVVSLHGAGSNHRLNLRRVFGKHNLPGESDVEATRYFPEWRDVDYIVISPFARGTMGYQGIAEKDVYDAIEDVKRRFSIDEDRIYLTGLSMGGGGTLWLGLTRPDIWAAIAPVCPAPPQGTEALAGNALNLPVHLFQGDADQLVRPEWTREWVRRFREAGVSVEYAEYPGVGHDSWVNAYADGQIFEWFGQFRRNRYPDRVQFATWQYKYSRAYWVRIDRLTPGTLASIDARFVGPNRLEVTTKDLDAFTFELEGHPQYSAGRPVEVRIDGRAVRVRPGEPLSFQRRGDRGGVGGDEPGPGAKRAGAEGPIADAIAGRHIYVYGTAGNPTQEELQARRERAVTAANWAVDRGAWFGRVMVFPRVVADRDVRPSDLESANLVLFGTKETNSLIAQFADRLPLHLTGPEAEYGLVYVYPLNGRYVVVSSGVPWWQTPGLPRVLFFPPVQGALQSMQDYRLFRASGEVVAEGRFDGEWRLPAGEAEKLRATGVVAVTAGGVAQAAGR